MKLSKSVRQAEKASEADSGKSPIYISKKNYEEKHVDLLLRREQEKWNYVLFKDFNIFMYNNTWHCARKHLCCFSLHAFTTEEKCQNIILQFILKLMVNKEL